MIGPSPQPRTPPHPHTLKILVAPLIVLVIASNVAGVMWAPLSRDHPLLLIALSSINRHLLLVSDQLDPISYYGVGTIRLLVSDPLFFLLGYWYGDRALAWMDERSPSYGPILRKGQGLFARAAWLLVLVAPNNYICLFAGAAGMRVGVFFALNLVGTLGRLYLLRVVGDVFSGPLDSVRDVIGRYQWQLILVSALMVLWSVRKEFSPGGEIDVLTHVDDDLAGEAELLASQPDGGESGQPDGDDDPTPTERAD